MNTYFSATALEQLKQGHDEVSKTTDTLIETFLLRPYRSKLGNEFARHGICRRLKTIRRCITQVFSLLPPENDELPDKVKLTDVEVYLQAFVFNAFGILDNLAFVWVNETNLTKPNGQPVPHGRIGLTADKDLIRKSLPSSTQAYLTSREPWFQHMESFRHSLAHRIPLYVPPYIIDPKDIAKSEDLERRAWEALQGHKFKKYDRLRKEQTALFKFRPWMQHSFSEATVPVVFHAQIIADFKTVVEMCNKIRDVLP